MPAALRAATLGRRAFAGGRTAATPPANRGPIPLVVRGGKHAGAGDAVRRSGGASFGLAGPGPFGNQYSIQTGQPNELSGAQLVVDGVTGNKTTTTGFVATIMFGKLPGGGTLDLDTRPDASRPTGQGQLTLKYGGGKGPATVHLVGETAAHKKHRPHQQRHRGDDGLVAGPARGSRRFMLPPRGRVLRT